MPRSIAAVLFLATAACLSPACAAEIQGELKQWHAVELSWVGPETSETASPNPFSDYRIDVTFTHESGESKHVVPGFYAADGDAADSGADTGAVWRARFAPDRTGKWNYAVSFRAGEDVAVAADAASGASAGFFDGETGSIEVAATDKTGRDFRGRGRLEYVGKHHLRFAGDGTYFLKAGADAPENLLAYDDFDDTPDTPRGKVNNTTQKYLLKDWSPHAGDYDATAEAYTWRGGRGSELLGAIKYLHDKGLNAFSFLTFSVDGDDDNVFPHRLRGTVEDYESVANDRRWGHPSKGVHHDRFDVSKLAQWNRVFAYGDELGMHLHFKTMETENELLMDGGDLGRERKLYYRELIARFGHHLALNWNLGEEINGATTAQKQAWAAYFWNTDPYRHPIVIHNMGQPHYDLIGPYDAAAGTGSELTGFSLQTNRPDFSRVFQRTRDYITRSAAAGKPWVVACDEPGDAQHSIRPDNDAGNSHVDGRKNALWGTLMAGGWGNEYYFGYGHAHSDLTLEDFRSRDDWW
ncbi:MAG: DUF5060 domain-containing protein, partial [Planctomycetota bacterium]